ncbi:MAG: hypothetical protein ACIPMY_00815 [Rickettsia endosymbiont of Pentastiridius leporinus]
MDKPRYDTKRALSIHAGNPYEGMTPYST